MEYRYKTTMPGVDVVTKNPICDWSVVIYPDPVKCYHCPPGGDSLRNRDIEIGRYEGEVLYVEFCCEVCWQDTSITDPDLRESILKLEENP